MINNSHLEQLEPNDILTNMWTLNAYS